MQAFISICHLDGAPAIWRGGGGGGAVLSQPQTDPIREGLEKIDEIKVFSRGKSIYGRKSHDETNLKFEAVKGLFDKSTKIVCSREYCKADVGCD